MPRKSRRRSWGSITERVKGRKYVLRWVENTKDGRRRLTETVYGTYIEATRRLAEIRVKAEEPPVMTVRELWERYELPALKNGIESGSLSKSTLANYRSKWKNYIAPRWGNCACNRVKPLDVQEWLSGLSVSNGKICRAVLKVTLDFAVMYEIISSNPADKPFRYGRDTSKEKSVYTEDELAALWEIVRGSCCEVPFLLSAHAGLRVGEACGLPIANIEYVDGAAAVTVESQLRQDGEIGAALKTRGSTRVVGLPAPWGDRLREIIAGYPEQAMYANDLGIGEPIPRWQVSQAWQELVRGSAVRYLPMQALRPSFETYMHWRAKVPLEKMAKIMGHTKPTTTAEHYDRPTGRDLVEVAVEAARSISKK